MRALRSWCGPGTWSALGQHWPASESTLIKFLPVQSRWRGLPPYRRSMCWGCGSCDSASPSLLLFSVSSLSPFLCRSCAVSPQFFYRWSCSVCRYRFDVFMGGSEFRVFLCCHLGSEVCLSIIVVDPLKMSFFPLFLLFIFVFGFQHFTMKLPTYGLLCIFSV